MQDWFATWFNSPYYHILYKDRDLAEAEAFIDALVAHLQFAKGARALDLACGKGRHARYLHKSGFDVVGVDLAQESIEHAQQFEKPGLAFFKNDMRSLNWQAHFDLVVNLFTSFGYFHDKNDDQKTISSVANALKKDGKFVLDFLNATKVKANLVASEEKHIDGIDFKITRSIEKGVIVKRIHIIDGQAEYNFQEQVDALELADFQTYFGQAGLEVKEVFGDYNLNPFDAQTSDRLILIAKK